jgi:hypothetical protein
MFFGVTRGALVVLAAILLVALGLRFAWLAATDTELLPLSDPQYYHATATNLAEGRGYSVAVDERGFVSGPASEGTAFWAPGYPLALAPLYKAFDSDQRAAKVFNAVVGALTVVPVFVLGRALGAARAGGARPANARTRDIAEGTQRRARTSDAGITSADGVGLAAAGLFAVAPSLVFWTASLFSEPLFTFAIASTLALAVWAGERRSLAAYFVVGLALIATAFVRSQGALMIVPVAVLLVRDFDLRSLVRVFAPVAVATLLLVGPWAIRNEGVMGRPYLINNNLGYNLRLAHAPYSEGTSVPPQDLWDEQPGISFKERELLFDDLGRERALEYAREHPGRELELAVKRVGYLLQSDAEASIEWSESLGLTAIDAGDRALWILLGDVYWYLLLLLSVASAFVLPRTREAYALWSAALVWVLLHTVFAGEPRYHVPVMPVLVVLAAATLLRALDAVRASDTRESASIPAPPRGND